MNKKFLTTNLLLVTLLCGCNQSPKPAQQESKNTEPQASTQTARLKRVARIHVPIATDFQNIISIGGVNIIYTQGSDCNIELEGDSALLRHVNVDIESGVLTLNVKADSNKDINRYESNYGITAYITTPELQCVSLCESGNFTCEGKWESSKIHIGCMSTGRFDVNEIECETFKYESSDFDKSHFKSIKAQTASIFGYRKCHGTFHVETDHLEIICNGESCMTITGQARTKVIEKRDKGILKDEVRKI
ncbi:MAG: DUF2807 domain-containing protein [Bacteroidaceae bacterium]|nr:DUF2807 domain-containing protein [Bacteroidaceae bacterium]